MPEQLTQAIAFLINSLPAIIGTIIGASISLLSPRVARNVAESGRLDVFCKIVFSKIDQKGFGIFESVQQDELALRLPMWIELANTSAATKYIRNFNIVAYNNRKKVTELVQLQRGVIGKETEIEFGNHQSYSFVVESKTIPRYDVEFVLKESDLRNENKTFNILKARYYNENGKKIERTIYSSKHPIEWKIGAINHNKEWMQI